MEDLLRQLVAYTKILIEQNEVLIQLSIPRYVRPEKVTDESRALGLCDFQHTRKEIVRKLGKPQGRVDVILNGLRKAGRIRSVTKEGQTYYVRLP